MLKSRKFLQLPDGCMYHVTVMSSTDMDPCYDSSIKRDNLMRLPEDGPIYGPKHVATIESNQCEQFDWFIFIFVLMDGLSSSPVRVKRFFLLHSAQISSGAQLASCQVVTGQLFTCGVKRPERESDHSPPTNAEVKNNGGIHPLLHMPSWRSA
jgi:hypothetical protein